MKKLLAKSSSAILLALLAGACIKKTASSKQNAFEINRGNFTNRIYAAYSKDPVKLTWYYCQGEPTKPAYVFTTNAPRLPLEIRLSRAWNGKNADPAAGAEIEVQGAIANSAASLLGKEFKISHTERMSVADFTDPDKGKNCQPLVQDQDLASATSQSDNKLQQAVTAPSHDNAMTAKIIGTMASCAGLGKETLVASAVVAQGNAEKMKSILGFGVNKVTRQNVGGTLLSFVTGTVFCGLGTKGLFEDALNRNYLDDENQKIFLQFQAKVVQKATKLLAVENWNVNFSDYERARLLPVRDEMLALQRDYAEAERVLLNKSSTEQQVADAHLAQARIFYPIYAATWNDIEIQSVTQTMGNSEKLMSALVNGFNGVLGRINQVFTNPSEQK